MAQIWQMQGRSIEADIQWCVGRHSSHVTGIGVTVNFLIRGFSFTKLGGVVEYLLGKFVFGAAVEH